MSVMGDAETTSYDRRARRADLGADLAILVVGLAGAAVILTQVPADVVAMRALAVYALFAALGAGVLAVARLRTRTFPGLREATVDGRPARGVRAWSGPFVHSVSLDVGLVALGAVVSSIGVASGSAWAALWVPALVATAWFAVRVVLVLVGRRRVDALWLTDQHVVHDSAAGRARIPRTDVESVRPWSGGLFVDGPTSRSGPPLGFRAGARARPGELRVDTSLMGVGPHDLAAWLRAQLDDDARPRR
jgi:hypothetical protein